MSDVSKQLIGVVTAIEVDGEQYTVPLSKENRSEFVYGDEGRVECLKQKIEEIRGVSEMFVEGTTPSRDSFALAVKIEAEENQAGNFYISSNLRSLSRQLRDLLEEEAYISSHEVIKTPDSINAEKNLYKNRHYFIDLWVY